jgi:hypothetical protein
MKLFTVRFVAGVALILLSCTLPTISFPVPTQAVIPPTPFLPPTYTQMPQSEVLPASTLPAPEATNVPASSINGSVWHDLCALPTLGGLPSPLPAGCVPSGDTAEANGIKETGESGIPGIQVDLHQGACTNPVIASLFTDSNGSYTFQSILGMGAFCITVNPLISPNDSILIPGGWTYPSKGASAAQTIVNLSPGQSYQVDFGWGFQFLP